MTAQPDPAPSLSVLTLARGREVNLRNVVLGLAQQRTLPLEMIIGVMQAEPYRDLPDTPFPIRQIPVEGDALPLSRARNAVAAEALGDVLAFLDVDCIPDPNLGADYLGMAERGTGLVMGEVLYLPAGASSPGWTFGDFPPVAVRHSDRQGPPDDGKQACTDYRCFWSLNFAMHRDDWHASGGFDERFTGYGGEDTDFGRSLAEAGMPIWWIRGARVYHQYHPHCMPPIQHVASILRNTEIFASKWGHRTMEHWIHAFRMMGLVETCSTGLRMVREPGPEDFALCAQGADMPYAATGRVLRILEDRARAKVGLPPDAAPMAERHARMTRAQEALLTPAAPQPAG